MMSGIAIHRNRYFTGKFMSERDFATDPEYFLSRHRLHHRLFHGWGIVCGLDVVDHPREECRDRWVEVLPGIAVDGRGREVVFEEAAAVEVLPCPDDDSGIAPSGSFVVVARYAEEEVEPVPALYAEGTADPKLREANRLRELARIEVLPVAEVGDPAAGEGSASPPPEWVALALVRRPDQAGEALVIDPAGRRELGDPTRIEAINWPHGGTLSLAHLREEMDGALKLSFSSPLRPADGTATGVNPYTLVVEAAVGGGSRQPLAGTPKLSDDGEAALFRLDPEVLADPEPLGGKTVFVTLRCDFILDRAGNPIDGGHLRGRLPGGRGAPGGVFESWFHVEAAPAGGDQDSQKQSEG
ncbi:MAG: hypothetical protein GY856_01235 [bacterium]|nr:hypothetical protein [bacterium]